MSFYFERRTPDKFLTPYLRRNRFFEAVRNSRHKVFPLWPGGSRDFAELIRDVFDDSDEEAIAVLDDSDAYVGFPVGAINYVTVVEVRSAIAQAWMDTLKLNPGARIWTPTARYYLFDHIGQTSRSVIECSVPGIRILNDGEWIPYPGNLADGDLSTGSSTLGNTGPTRSPVNSCTTVTIPWDDHNAGGSRSDPPL